MFVTKVIPLENITFEVFNGIFFLVKYNSYYVGQIADLGICVGLINQKKVVFGRHKLCIYAPDTNILNEISLAGNFA